MNRLFPCLFTTLVALLGGCITIRSNVAPVQPPRFKNVLVVSRLTHVPARYVQQYARVFPRMYRVCTVADNQLQFIPSDSLIRRAAESCRADVLLILQVNNPEPLPGNRYVHSRFQELYAEMRPYPTGAPFWKAVITGSNVRPARNRDYIDPRQLVQRLRKDGVIGGEIPPP